MTREDLLKESRSIVIAALVKLEKEIAEKLEALDADSGVQWRGKDRAQNLMDAAKQAIYTYKES